METAIRSIAYSLYKTVWQSRYITDEMDKQTHSEYMEAKLNGKEKENLRYPDYVAKYGWDGLKYENFEDFLEKEYRDDDFIADLFSLKYPKPEALIALYKEDVVML